MIIFSLYKKTDIFGVFAYHFLYLCICVSVYLCICVSVYVRICVFVYERICVSAWRPSASLLTKLWCAETAKQGERARWME